MFRSAVQKCNWICNNVYSFMHPIFNKYICAQLEGQFIGSKIFCLVATVYIWLKSQIRFLYFMHKALQSSIFFPFILITIVYFCFKMQCSTYGCLLELTIQLSVVMLGKQTLNNVVELGVP